MNSLVHTPISLAQQKVRYICGYLSITFIWKVPFQHTKEVELAVPLDLSRPMVWSRVPFGNSIGEEIDRCMAWHQYASFCKYLDSFDMKEGVSDEEKASYQQVRREMDYVARVWGRNKERYGWQIGRYGVSGAIEAAQEERIHEVRNLVSRLQVEEQTSKTGFVKEEGVKSFASSVSLEFTVVGTKELTLMLIDLRKASSSYDCASYPNENIIVSEMDNEAEYYLGVVTGVDTMYERSVGYDGFYVYRNDETVNKALLLFEYLQQSFASDVKAGHYCHNLLTRMGNQLASMLHAGN